MPLPPPVTPKKSLAALHLSLVVMVGFLVAVAIVTAFPGGRALVEEHFAALRAVAYLSWAVGIAAFVAAPVLLVKDLGILSSLQLRRVRAALHDAGGRPLLRALALGAVGNVVVLAASPLGAALGEHYTWDVFRAHLVVSTLVVAVSSGRVLMRVRAILEEVAAVATPERARFAEPTGF